MIDLRTKLSKFFVFVILISNSLGNKVIQIPEDKSVFVKGQDIVLVTDRADIVLEFDLLAPRQEIDHVCNYSDVVKKANLSGLITNRFDDLCHVLIQRWYRVFHLFGFGQLGRTTRGLISTVASFLVGGISGSIWHEDHSAEAIHELQDQEDMLNRAIHQEDAHISMVEDHLKDIVKVMASEERKEAIRHFSEMSAIGITASYQLAAQDMDRVLGGLEGLAVSSHLPPGLLKAGTLTAHLKTITRKAAPMGLAPVLTTELELLREPVSFAAMRGNTVRVVLHVPLAPIEWIFETWRHVPTPVTVHNSSLMITLDPGPNTIIAMTRSQDLYFEIPEFPGDMTRRALLDVDQVRLSKDFHATCLSALMSGHETSIKAKCKAHSAPLDPKQWRLEEDTIMVYHPRPLLLKVSCGGRPVAEERFQGTRTIKLKHGCRASSDALIVATGRTLSGGVIRYTAGHPGLSYDDLTISKSINASHLAAKLLDSSSEWQVHSPHLPPPGHQHLPDPPPSTLQKVTAVIVLSLLVILGLTLLAKGCGSWIPCRGNSRTTHRHRSRRGRPGGNGLWPTFEESSRYSSETESRSNRGQSRSPPRTRRRCQDWSPIETPPSSTTQTRLPTRTWGGTRPRPAGPLPDPSPQNTSLSRLLGTHPPSRTNPWTSLEMRDFSSPLTSRMRTQTRTIPARRSGMKWLTDPDPEEDPAPENSPREGPPQASEDQPGPSTSSEPRNPNTTTTRSRSPSPSPTQPPNEDREDQEDGYQRVFPLRFRIV